MKSNFGDCFQISVFGESHSEGIGVVINGLAAGIELSVEGIKREMEKRKAAGSISTKRHESDEIEFLSGFFNGKTTGTPLCIYIKNRSQKSGDYEKNRGLIRPSHADFTAHEKYFGCEDYRGGGHFSGRLTAPITAAGGVAKQILAAHNIHIGAHIYSLHDIDDRPFSQDMQQLDNEIIGLDSTEFPTLDKQKGEEMYRLAEKAAAEGDSVGGVLEIGVSNMPTGIGEPLFGSIESKLSALLFSVPAVKGVEFGLGFGFKNLYGSEANDAFYTNGSEIFTKTNNNGGINGGISNGMPIIIRAVVKPTPSIYKPQQTVDINKMENAELQICGRHDSAIIHRARVVAEAVTAIGLTDLFCERYGYEWTGN